ncbi:MAG: hypothetical protein JL50_18485 [Peptococcaceae bacterium BICA1-7]|nr:MAG: hypothetical protein JL50_18485 [Peptococcaceae bacterium BICA1-7]HBV99078.1 hypothetical protein [Desulfotomaculum sp.]
MENARQLDERLRRIIREVSTRTGGEIKIQMVEEFTRSVDAITTQSSRNQTAYLLLMIKKSLDQLD